MGMRVGRRIEVGEVSAVFRSSYRTSMHALEDQAVVEQPWNSGNRTTD
jgi:hypothetical protein